MSRRDRSGWIEEDPKGWRVLLKDGQRAGGRTTAMPGLPRGMVFAERRREGGTRGGAFPNVWENCRLESVEEAEAWITEALDWLPGKQ